MPRMPAPPRAAVAAVQATVPPRPFPPARPPLATPNPSKRELMAKAREAKKAKAANAPSKHSKMSWRHTLILYMDLAGERVVDIALKLDMHPATVSGIRCSPLYQAQRERIIEQITAGKFENLLDFIRADAIKNVEVAVSIRDNELEETKDRLGAVRVLQKEVDRVYPRITKSSHTEERTVKITIGAEKLARIGTALREVGALLPDSIDIEALSSDTEPEPAIRAQSIDELRAELLNAAERAAD